MRRLLPSFVLCACATTQTPVAHEGPLGRATIDVLEREACPRLVVRTFPIDDPTEHATTGKLWVRRCAAHANGADLAVDVDVFGWQWVGAGSWGFDVREYVYFKASVRANIRADVEVDDTRPVLRVWSASPPEVEVHALGRVSARADGPAAGLLGVTLGIFGQGPNVLATSALRSGVADRIRDNAIRGVTIALGETPPPGAPAISRPTLFHEAEKLFPGGALISGSFPPSIPTTLTYDVGAEGSVLARPMCIDDVLPLVDAVVEGSAIPHAERPADVLVLKGRGEIALPPRPCPWVIVTGSSTETPVTVTMDLARGYAPRAPQAHRWVGVTLLAYEIDSPDTRLFGFTVTNGDARSSFGRPLTRSKSPAVRLVARPVEAANGTPIAIDVYSWRPRPPSFWNPKPMFDETLIGHATIDPVPGREHEERRAVVEHDGAKIGWVQVALDSIEVP